MEGWRERKAQASLVRTPLFTFCWQCVVMMRTQPDIHRQHIETWQQKKNTMAFRMVKWKHQKSSQGPLTAVVASDKTGDGAGVE